MFYLVLELWYKIIFESGEGECFSARPTTTSRVRISFKQRFKAAPDENVFKNYTLRCYFSFLFSPTPLLDSELT